MMERNITGRITDIQRFSLHDGPGIRTSVFMKGCNMNCAWCHNPETISREIQVILDPSKCIHCGKCAEGCFSGARQIAGRDVTVGEVMQAVRMDRAYYEAEGGVTVTGGEPTLQPDFVETLLEQARSEGIGTAIETNLAAPPGDLLRVARLCDVIMCDVKAWDSALHRAYTGVGNADILENLRRVDRLNIPLIVRTPIVVGVNDNIGEIGAIARCLQGIRNLRRYDLLPYHALGLSKAIEGQPARRSFQRPSPDRMRALADAARAYVQNVTLQGERI